MDIDCSSEELAYYGLLVGDRSVPSTFGINAPKHKIGTEFFRRIVAHLYNKYPCEVDFQRCVTLLVFLFGADYFQ